jgi:hypothetical protein
LSINHRMQRLRDWITNNEENRQQTNQNILADITKLVHILSNIKIFLTNIF